MKVTASVQVLPLKAEMDVGQVVDKVIDVLRHSGLRYEVNAHSTVIEADFEDVIRVFENIKRVCENLCERCVISLQVDIKKGGVGIDEKVSRYRR